MNDDIEDKLKQALEYVKRCNDDELAKKIQQALDCVQKLNNPPGDDLAPDIIEAIEGEAEPPFSSQYQLFLYNDEHSSLDHVIDALINVVQLTTKLAMRVAAEAHLKGRALADVGSKDDISAKEKQLQNDYKLFVRVAIII